MAKTIKNLLGELESGKITAVQLTTEVLEQLKSLKDFNVVISDARARALQRAAEVDAARKKGEPLGRLAGIPFIAKDNFLTFGTTTTAASKMLEPFEAPYQATAIERLEVEGAIMVAKANLDAFAHGSSTENSYFGPTKNPHDTTRVPGGSSGGSAAVVALNIVPFALGTDTGGSIRLPASYCGVVGVKPTYGTVSRFGVVAMASSTDVIGPLANTIDDAALVLDIMAGKDERDSTVIDHQRSLIPADLLAAKPKIGMVKEYMSDAVQPEVREAILARADQLRKLGYTVEEVSVPSVELALAVYYIVVPAEVSSNLSRYDGIKYGSSASKATSLSEVYGQTRDQGFMPENKRRILIGTYVLSSGYYDAYYRKAQTVRSKMIHDLAQVLRQYPVLLGPVAPTTAFKLGENAENPLQMYLADIMTVAASLAGLPALSLPIGNDQQGLPIGLQLIGNQRSDADLFAIAKQLEGASNG